MDGDLKVVRREYIYPGNRQDIGYFLYSMFIHITSCHISVNEISRTASSIAQVYPVLPSPDASLIFRFQSRPHFQPFSPPPLPFEIRRETPSPPECKGIEDEEGRREEGDLLAPNKVHREATGIFGFSRIEGRLKWPSKHHISASALGNAPIVLSVTEEAARAVRHCIPAAKCQEKSCFWQVGLLRSPVPVLER